MARTGIGWRKEEEEEGICSLSEHGSEWSHHHFQNRFVHQKLQGPVKNDSYVFLIFRPFYYACLIIH